MINAQKLKDRIRNHGFRQEDVARQLGLKQSSFNQKINNVRPMFLSEAEKIAEILNISDAEFGRYFFNRDVA